MGSEVLTFYPEEVIFTDVRPNQTYIQSLEITNTTQTSLSLRIRPGNAERFTVEPATITLGPAEARKVQCKLKLVKPLPRKKSGPYKDSFQIKSEYFERKVPISFWPSSGTDGKENINNREHISAAAPPKAHPKPTQPQTISVPGGIRDSFGGQQAERSATPDSLEVNVMGEFESSVAVRKECEGLIKKLREDHDADIRAREAFAQGLKTRLDRAEAESQMRRKLEEELKEMRLREHDLTERNREMQHILDDQDERTAEHAREAEYLDGLRRIVESGLPDLAKVEQQVLERNSEEREERDRKVLRILKAKDQKLGELQGENAGLMRMLEQTRAQVDALEADVRRASKQVEEMMLEREEAVRMMHSEMSAERERGNHVREQLESAQRELLAAVTAKRQLQETARDKSRLEAEVDDMLRDRTKMQDRINQLERVAAEAAEREAKMAEMQRQLHEQGEQLDALVVELASYSAGALASSDVRDLEDLRARVRQLEAEKSRLEAASLDAERVFSGQVEKMRRGGDAAGDAQAKIARLEAALALAERNMTRAAAESIQHKDTEIASLKSKVRDLQQERHVHMPLNSTGSITLAESEGDAMVGGGRAMEELRGALAREQALEKSLKECKLNEQKLRTQVAKLERIQTTAQTTALQQEEKLQKAVNVIGKSSEALDQTTDRLSREAGSWKQRAEHLQTQVCEYDTALVELEKDLEQCKRTLRLYHDRIVQLVGPEDEVVHTTKHWENKVPLSVHLRTTGRLGKQHASERRRLEQTIEAQARALEETREELMHTQAAKVAAEHECERKMTDHDSTIRELQHQIRCRRDDGAVRLQELEQTIKVLASKSEMHKKVAALSAEISALKVSEQRLTNDVQFFEDKARRAEEELRTCTERVANLQVKLRSVPNVQGRSEMLVSTMSDQIEQQQHEIERLEVLLRVAKEEHDRREGDTSRRDDEMHATKLMAESHERRVTELQGDVLRLEKELRDAHESVRSNASAVRRGEEARQRAEKTVTGMREQLLLAEESAVLAKASVADRVHTLTSRAAAEVSEASERAAERGRERDAALLEVQQLRDRCSEAQARISELDRECEQLRVARREVSQEARDADVRAKQAQEMAQRENERLQLNLTSASGQLSVLMETVETLQKGGSAEQVAANLTARISACMAETLQVQLSNAQLHHWLEDRVWQCGQLDSQLAAMRDKASSMGEKLHASKAQAEVLSREVHALKAALSTKDAELVRALRAQDRSAQHASDMEIELAAYRKGLDDERARHAGEVRELESAAACEADKMRQLFAAGGPCEESLAAQKDALDQVVARVLEACEGDGGDVASRLREALAECAAQVDACMRSKMVLEWELKQKVHRARVLTSALDVSLTSQRLAEQQLAASNKRWDMETFRGQSAAWARGSAMEQKIELLTGQLDSANKRSIDLGAQCAKLMQERDALSQVADGLQRKQDAMGMDHEDALIACEEAAVERAAKRLESAHDELREYVRTEIGRLLSGGGDEDPSMQGARNEAERLTMEILALRCANDALADRFGASQKRQDTLRRQLASCKDAARRSEQRLSEALDELTQVRRRAPLPEGIASVEHIIAVLDEREAALFAARSDARFEATQCEQAREEAAEHASQRDAAEAREREACQALAACREEAARELAVQRDMLMQELRRADTEMSGRWEGVLREAEAEAQQRKERVLEENAMLRRTLEEARDMLKHREESRSDACVNTDAPEVVRLDDADREARREEEMFLLRSRVGALEAQTATMRDEIENKADVIRSLEAVIAQAAAKESARSGGGASSVAKQIVSAKVAEAESQRKLKRAASIESELRQALNDKEAEIRGMKHVLGNVSVHAARASKEADDDAQGGHAAAYTKDSARDDDNDHHHHHDVGQSSSSVRTHVKFGHSEDAHRAEKQKEAEHALARALVMLESRDEEIQDLKTRLALAQAGDNGGLLEKIAGGDAERDVLRADLEAVKAESAGVRETLEHMMKMQADSERAAMRQLEDLTGTIQALARAGDAHGADVAGHDVSEDVRSAGGGWDVRHDAWERYEGDRNEGGREVLGTIQERSRDVTVDTSAAEVRVPRVSVGRSVGRLLVRSDRTVEHSLQRLVSTLTDQIRDKAAAIEKLEASKRKGAYAGAAALKQLRAQLGDMTRQRDAIRREAEDAQRRVEVMAAQRSSDSLASGGSSTHGASRRAVIKIKEPLKERCDKEVMAVKQKMVEMSSRHAIEVDRMRAKLLEARGRVAALESERAMRDDAELARLHLRIAVAGEDAIRLVEAVGVARDIVDLAQQDYRDVESAWQSACVRIDEEQRRRREVEEELNKLKRDVLRQEQDLRACEETRRLTEKENMERIRSLESSRNALVKTGDDKARLKEEIVALHQEVYSLQVRELAQARRMEILEGQLKEKISQSQQKDKESAAAKSKDSHKNEGAAAGTRIRVEDLQLEQARCDLEALGMSERCGRAEADLAAARAALERVRRDREDDLDRWEGVLNRNRSVLETMQRERDEAEVRAVTAEEGEEAARRTEGETREELVEAVREVNALRAACARLQEQLSQVKGLLADKDAVIANLKDACAALGQGSERVVELEKLLADEARARRECESMLAEVEQRTKRQMSTLQDELDRFSAEQESLQAEYVREVEDLREKLRAKDLALEQSQQQMQQQQQQHPPERSINLEHNRSHVLPPPDSPVSSRQPEQVSPPYVHPATGGSPRAKRALRELESEASLIASLRARVQDLEEALARAASTPYAFQQPSGAMELLRHEIDSLRSELQENKQVVVAQAREMSQGVREREELRSEARRLRTELNSTVEELAKATERADASERKSEEARGKMWSELSMAADEIERLQRKLKEKDMWVSQSDVDALKEELRRTNEQVKALKEDAVRKGKLFAAVKGDRVEQEVALKALSEEKDALDEKLKRLTKEVKAKDTALKEMRARIGKEEEKDVGQEEEMTKLQDKLRTVERDLQRKEVMCKELKNKVGELLEEKEAMGKKLEVSAAAKEQVKRLKSELERREDALRMAKARGDAAIRECDALKEELREAELREARVHKATSARAGEVEVIAERMYALEDVVRGTCGALIGQIEGVGAKLGGTGGGRRVQDGTRMIESSLKDPLNQIQLRDCILGLVDDRVSLELACAEKLTSAAAAAVAATSVARGVDQGRGDAEGASVGARAVTGRESIRQSVAEIGQQLGISLGERGERGSQV